MRLPRNPFRALKAESLESHDLFLRLFQPIALGALPENPWESVQVIRSAQGGGKTSLLRVLTPECLLRVADGTSRHLSDTAEQIRRIGAIADDRPTVLGVYIPLSTTPYATLARADLGNQSPLHLFYALLDARIVLTTLRGVQTLRGLEAEEDLGRITLAWPSDRHNPLFEFESVVSLMQWARNLERDIWRAVDRGKAQTVADLGHATPYALEAFSSHCILIDGKPMGERIVVLIDDSHKLVPEQRKSLLEHVITARLSVSVWVAERMYAMEPYELLALDTGSSARECNTVPLSKWWQRATDVSTHRFYNELASRRLQQVAVETPFDQLLAPAIDDALEQGQVAAARADLEVRLETVIASDARFSEIDLADSQAKSNFERLVDLKAIELYVAGIRNRVQSTFDFEALVTPPTSTEISQLRATAEYQVCKQNGLPLYYGSSELFKIASWNVDQLLSIAAAVFDQYDAQRVRNSGSRVLPRVQDKILHDLAEAYWSGLPKRMLGGERFQRFLQAFARHALSESLGPTAKYPPGITGFGITSQDHDRLRNATREQDAHLRDLAELLSSAVAHNVVFMKADSKQGRAGETVTVFYLNRLLCVYFDLPIGLGGWWKRKVDHFAKLLVDEGKSVSKSQGSFFVEETAT